MGPRGAAPGAVGSVCNRPHEPADNSTGKAQAHIGQGRAGRPTACFWKDITRWSEDSCLGGERSGKFTNCNAALRRN